MAGRIVVTGGTGTLGAAVLDVLVPATQDGDEIAIVSRRPAPETVLPYRWLQADYASGAGLDAAVEGASAIIHCANDQRDTRADRAMIEAGRRANVHLVYISIVGVDRIHLGYYGRKFEVEQEIQRSGVPWTILRTTQFHDLVAMLCRGLARSPIAVAPSIPIQPVDVREVAARLVELANGEPAGRVPDMGGPQVRPFGDFLRAYLAARRMRRPIVPLRLPGALMRDLRRGYGITPEHAAGRVTFEEFLSTVE